MARLVLVCGSTGAGKTTYSMCLAEEAGAVRFSIDPWMQRLFSDDMESLDYSWIMERVDRCHEQIWEVSRQWEPWQFFCLTGIWKETRWILKPGCPGQEGEDNPLLK